MCWENENNNINRSRSAVRYENFSRRREEELIESDSRFSKANYGSRKNYSIESVLLKKQLVFDNSMLLGKEQIYAVTDLQ